MKKFLAIVLALSMVFALCAVASAEPAKEITLWTYPIGKWVDAETMDALMADFEAATGIKVTVEYLDYQSGDDQVNTAIEGKAAPDLIMEGPERLVMKWGVGGFMAPLNDLYELDAAQGVYDSLKNACQYEGTYYEVPLCMVAHNMAINYDVFEAADALQYIDLETRTWTTENFIKAVDAVYAYTGMPVATVYCGGQGGDQGTRALVNNLYNGTYTNAEHTEYTANSPENVKALELLQGWEAITFDPGIVAGDEIQLFRQGMLNISWCWNASQQTNSDNGEPGYTNDGSRILMMNFPSEDGKAELCGGIWGFGIFDNGNPDKVEAAKEFIKFFCYDENEVVKAVRASSFFPVRAEVQGVFEGTATEDIMNEYSAIFLPNLGDYYNVIPGWAGQRTEWWNMLQRIGAGGDVQAETDAFVAAANALAAG